MRAHRPRIGLTTYYKQASWGDWQRTAAIVPAPYIEAVTATGAVPLLLPPPGAEADVLEVLDGLIVIGGADLDPATYGAEPHPLTEPEPIRDGADLTLTRAALDTGMPLLAICRGIQVLNVALGGTVLQHVPDAIGHDRYRPAPGRFGEVSFRTEPGSRIAAVLGERATAPCYHHQALDQVADSLRVTARSEEGLVQAAEPEGPAWVLGVQFHPEENDGDRRLFAELTRQARQYRQGDR
ncbi:MAG TPA: gamma-glutamyl-gamma-aminobutyrate hydrolase family protein [Beutenbergiaceae bacterium]|nr:gamma-glutamyl-gamma-aminobutyrate hydrolase family protein [Beutenbergiaceae bacterium]